MTAPTYAELSTAYRELFALIDPDTATERYDRTADAFYRETRIWPPGRSRPPAMGGDGVTDEERHRRWREWEETRWSKILHKHRMVVERLEPLIDSSGAALAPAPGKGDT